MILGTVVKKVGITREEAAVRERNRLARERRRRLVRELAKLDPAEEQALAEEGLGEPSPPSLARRRARTCR